jgi:hypothetical protein
VLEPVDAFEERNLEGGRRLGVAAAAQQQVHLGEDRPRDDAGGRRGQQLGGEAVAASLGTVERRDERAGVDDDQPAARRASTSSTRSDRSSSSSTRPA